VLPLNWAFRALLWLLFLLWSMVVLAWLVLHWVILPHIQQWRPQIEARASQALGTAVHIGQIEVRSGGWVPALELRDVVLRDAQGRPALSLPRIATALSPRSLLSLEPRLEQLLVEGAHLEVRRDAAGRIFVAGFDLSGSGSDDTAAADWLVRQHEIVIRGGSLRWTDERRNEATLQLDDVQLVMRNGLRQHDLRLDATPPPEWGERFTLRGRFSQALLARAGDWQRWSGAIHAELPRADLRELRRFMSLPFELSEGSGALRAWIDVRDGEPQGGTADVALRAVALRLATNVAPLRLEQVEGRVVGQRTAEGLTVALYNFAFLAADGTRWPAGDMSLNLRQRAGEPSYGGQFSAQRLDLGVMAQVAASLPLGDALRRLVSEVRPQGALSELAARWTGPLDAPTQYQVNAALSGLSLASRASSLPRTVGRPGLRNANLQLTANQAGGSAMLSLANGAIELPGVFEQPLLPLDRLTAQLQWKNLDGRLSVEVKDARFANRDAEGELSGTWRTGVGQGLARGGRFPGQIDLSGRLGNAEAARVSRYLPLHIPEATRRYVERAVRGGTLASVDLRVKGDLWDFPFFDASNKGEFRIGAQLQDVSFAFVPSAPADAVHPAYESPWPPLNRVKGEILLDRSSLLIRNAQAQFGQTQWTQMQGGIQDFTSEQPVFKLNSSGQGALAEMLRLVDVTPVGTWIHRSLENATGAGQAEMSLDLAIPLQNLEASEVRGSVRLAGNDVRITPASPMLEGARGRVDFSHQGFTVVNAVARAHGGEIRFEGGSQPDGTIRFAGQGSVTADDLRRAPEFGLLSHVAGWLQGKTDYRLELGFVQGHAEIQVTSNLVGLVSSLPAPLAKAANAPLQTRYETRIARESLAAGQALRDTLRLDVGGAVQAQYQRDISGDAPRVLRGGIGVMAPAPTPSSGVKAAIDVDSLDADAWQAIQDRLHEMGRAAGGEAAESGGYAPNALTLRAKELRFLSRRMNNVVAGLALEKGQWSANLDADQLDGYVEYRPPVLASTADEVTPGRVFARLSRLSLPPSEVDEVERLLDEQPATVPALDIVVNDFELRGKRLGRLEIEASNRLSREGGRPVRDWRLGKFNLLTPEAQLTANGRWSLGAGERGSSAEMDFNLALADSGAYLERLGMGRVVRGGKGQIIGKLAWLGSPLTIDYASLTGQASVAIESGQFLKADAGAARLLGVLSLQALPRRLSLDFRDVFEEGFAFDSFTGDLRIAQGVAHTNNLRMRGAQAAALMEGQADLARETQDLRVVVVPEIDAGTASLAYAIINPAVGLGTFLAQLFLRKPFIQAGTREFHVRGPWADPNIERVERGSGRPPPEVEALKVDRPPAANRQ
jgi:uncharacterized protein (TIGR02099 family)